MGLRDSDIPEDFYKVDHSRKLARMYKTKSGAYVDDYHTFNDGRKVLVAFPWSAARAEKPIFREMSMDEIKKYNKVIHGAEAKPSYEMLERQLKEANSKIKEPARPASKTVGKVSFANK